MKRLFSLFIIATIWACNSNERVKPAKISKDAIWKGGDDGGCWVLFGKVSENTIEATIFYENGDIWVKGIFKKQGNCQIPAHILTEKIQGFDGVNLITIEKCTFKR